MTLVRVGGYTLVLLATICCPAQSEGNLESAGDLYASHTGECMAKSTSLTTTVP
ncbi:hypothetical protein PF005_g4190 [Phytophthora fragariae]|uniref:Pectate lyase n=2 Tax=Phytophthora TaxID=4783 RepID=A0A6A3Z2A0_9STRA|nr:hypothetical protein PF003_g36195 [Phytophthora fragariae]KAE8990291.1 hypothetical protein PR002_g21193 [Phytophthora rubi]KAE8942247.1 hypothetical protein PF009_g7994 [Phytophthora fragariae]KAE9008479.1 hypothetical protein PF011_g10693 [Phytophthora fragariae]KAE9023118.1 hypothetical protein PR001_g12998 [Phytophthora rubi]